MGWLDDLLNSGSDLLTNTFDPKYGFLGRPLSGALRSGIDIADSVQKPVRDYTGMGMEALGFKNAEEIIAENERKKKEFLDTYLGGGLKEKLIDEPVSQAAGFEEVHPAESLLRAGLFPDKLPGDIGPNRFETVMGPQGPIERSVPNTSEDVQSSVNAFHQIGGALESMAGFALDPANLAIPAVPGMGAAFIPGVAESLGTNLGSGEYGKAAIDAIFGGMIGAHTAGQFNARGKAPIENTPNTKISGPFNVEETSAPSESVVAPELASSHVYKQRFQNMAIEYLNRVKDEVAKTLGDDTVNDIKIAVHDIPVTPEAKGAAFFDSSTNTIHLDPNRIDPSTLSKTILHEISHTRAKHKFGGITPEEVNDVGRIGHEPVPNKIQISPGKYAEVDPSILEHSTYENADARAAVNPDEHILQSAQESLWNNPNIQEHGRALNENVGKIKSEEFRRTRGLGEFERVEDTPNPIPETLAPSKETSSPEEGEPIKKWRVTINDGTTHLIDATNRGDAASQVRAKLAEAGVKDFKVAGVSEAGKGATEGATRPDIKAKESTYVVTLSDGTTRKQRAFSEEQAKNNVSGALKAIGSDLQVAGVEVKVRSDKPVTSAKSKVESIRAADLVKQARDQASRNLKSEPVVEEPTREQLLSALRKKDLTPEETMDLEERLDALESSKKTEEVDLSVPPSSLEGDAFSKALDSVKDESVVEKAKWWNEDHQKRLDRARDNIKFLEENPDHHIPPEEVARYKKDLERQEATLRAAEGKGPLIEWGSEGWKTNGPVDQVYDITDVKGLEQLREHIQNTTAPEGKPLPASLFFGDDARPRTKQAMVDEINDRIAKFKTKTEPVVEKPTSEPVVEPEPEPKLTKEDIKALANAKDSDLAALAKLLGKEKSKPKPTGKELVANAQKQASRNLKENANKPPEDLTPPEVIEEEAPTRPYTVTLSDGTAHTIKATDPTEAQAKVQEVLDEYGSSKTVDKVEEKLSSLEKAAKHEIDPLQQGSETVTDSIKSAKKAISEEVKDTSKLGREEEKLRKLQTKEKFAKKTYEIQLSNGETVTHRARNEKLAKEYVQGIINKRNSTVTISSVAEKLSPIDKALNIKPKVEPKKSGFLDNPLVKALNAVKAITFGGDVGHLLNQGKQMNADLLFSKDFKKVFEQFPMAFKFAKSEEFFNKFHEKLYEHPIIKMMVDNFNLDMPGLGKNLKEETFHGADLAENLPVVGKWYVRPSERVYTGGLNFLRAAEVIKLTDSLMKDGFTPENAPEKYQAVARAVNIISQRGEFSPAYQKLFSDASAIFGAPRAKAARIQNAFELFRGGESAKIVRKTAAKTLAFNVMLYGGLAASKKATFITDRDRSDFLKIRIGDKISIDPWTGLGVTARTANKILGGGTISAYSGKERDISTGDALRDEFIGGIAPGIKLFHELLKGEDLRGYQVPRIASLLNIVPMSARGIAELLQAGDIEEALALSMLQVGGERVDVFDYEKAQETDRELKESRGMPVGKQKKKYSDNY